MNALSGKSDLLVKLCVVSGLALVVAGCASSGTKKTEVLDNRDNKVAEPTTIVQTTTADNKLPAVDPGQEAREKDLLLEKVDAGKSAAKPVVAKPLTHTVAKGETLGKIADKFDVSTAELAAANHMKPADVLPIGKVLAIPAGGTTKAVKKPAAAKAPEKKAEAKPAAHKAADKGKTEAKAKVEIKPAKTAKADAKTEAKPAAPAGDGTKYTVQKGDFPASIAKKFNVKTDDLMAANNLKSATGLQVGQVLVIPGAKAVENKADVATPVTAAPVAAAPGPDAGALAATPAAVPPTAPAPGATPNTIEYNVVASDTLETIATMFGVKPEDITRLNPAVKSAADLKPGMSLVVPYR